MSFFTGEVEALLPVVATLLQFSPEEVTFACYCSICDVVENHFCIFFGCSFMLYVVYNYLNKISLVVL